MLYKDSSPFQFDDEQEEQRQRGAHLRRTGVAVEPIPRCRGPINETPMKEGTHLMTPVKPLAFMRKKN